MKCPIDGAELVIADRSGVEIDYCPRCRGVWLDRGELDKIIERSAAFSAPLEETSRAQEQRQYDERRRKKKGGMGDFLGDIFDF